MKNIHLLPTKNLSRLYLHSNGELQLRHNLSRTDDYLGSNQHLYITCEEEIKDCWVLNTHTNEVYFLKGYYGIQPITKKIILTTDQELIEDGVQAITNTFAEWFVENPTCEYVETKLVEFEVDLGLGDSCIEYGSYYNIIIPKEEITSKINLVEIPQEQLEKERNPNYEYFSIDEPKQENCCTPEGQIKRYVDCIGCDRKPKQETLKAAMNILQNSTYGAMGKGCDRKPKQETLEDTAKNAYKKHSVKDDTLSLDEQIQRSGGFIVGFKEGVKWLEERMYSEEEVKSAFKIGFFIGYSSPVNGLDSKDETCEEWFKQFKKK